MSSYAKRLARMLLHQNRHGRSWRVIVHEDYADLIPPGTLCRFAKSKGQYIPQQYIELLQIKIPRRPASKMIDEMTEEELRSALINRHDMPEPDPRIIKAFHKLGWLKREVITA